METKTITIPLQIKTLNNREFSGYGSVFGNVDWGNDVVVKGAFSDTLAQHKAEGTLPMMFWQHDPSQVPGKWLSMSEDEHGLQVKGVLADTTLGNDIHTLLGMKAVSGMSIGYIPTDTEYNADGVRLIKQADLIETSIVSIPMNPKAQIVHAKARLSANGEYVPRDDELAQLKRDVEQFLRSKGFSKTLSKTYVSNLFKVGEMPDEANEKAGDEIGEMLISQEINAGAQSFRDRLLLQDLDKQFTRLFKNGK